MRIYDFERDDAYGASRDFLTTWKKGGVVYLDERAPEHARAAERVRAFAAAERARRATAAAGARRSPQEPTGRRRPARVNYGAAAVAAVVLAALLLLLFQVVRAGDFWNQSPEPISRPTESGALYFP